MNLTPSNFTIQKAPAITSYCFDWCKDRVLENQNHILFSDLIIILLALFVFIGFFMSFTFEDYFLYKNVSFNKMKFIQNFTLRFGIAILLIFLVYKIWF